MSMQKNLVLFWGWSRSKVSYQGLIDSAHKDWKIYHISYPDLIPDGSSLLNTLWKVVIHSHAKAQKLAQMLRSMYNDPYVLSTYIYLGNCQPWF